MQQRSALARERGRPRWRACLRLLCSTARPSARGFRSRSSRQLRRHSRLRSADSGATSPRPCRTAARAPALRRPPARLLRRSCHPRPMQAPRGGACEPPRGLGDGGRLLRWHHGGSELQNHRRPHGGDARHLRLAQGALCSIPKSIHLDACTSIYRSIIERRRRTPTPKGEEWGTRFLLPS